ncbi:MAG: DNA-binding protein [Romboutsia sp.]|jgi:hypothetical protein|uniref:DNA-binding protein n=1 Tax=Aliarcobacter cryaerophilus TaxID=28198 RepID=A0A1V9VDA3_9BACT|nr:DNA-binding protein [Aliarcobacter cryaerophilus]TXH78767.1 MAG: DNA-binding protein [Romboutsia sp.]
MKNIVVYNTGELEVNVSIEEETLWLNQKQLGELFNVEIHTINYHIKNIFKQKELEKIPTIRKIRIVQQEGNRKVEREVEHYNLDMIISIGYRVNSITATKFRQWATSILKEYISKGYAVNTHKITEYRLANLENDMQIIKSKIKNDTLDLKQGIFYEGQFFDAYIFISDILKNAKKSITLIDNYIDGNTLLHLSSNKDLNINIITKSLTKELKVIIEKFNKQYKNLKVFEYSKSHDRFLIIDEKIIYHIGASLKDLGNKWFAFSKLEDDNFELLKRIANILGNK